MKKNLFNIESDEIKRILSLHEERTKNQYLNIISEQSATPKSNEFKVASFTNQTQLIFSTYFGDEGYVVEPQTAKFEASTNSNIATAKNVPIRIRDNEGNYISKKVNISFYCNQGKYFFTGDKNPYTQNKLTPNLVKNVCGKLSYQSRIAKAGKIYTQKSEINFNDTNNNQYRFTVGSKTQWKWDGKQGTISGGPGVTKTNDKTDYSKLVFSCTPIGGNYFRLPGGDSYKPEDKFKTFYQVLRKTFCQVNVNAGKQLSSSPSVPPPPPSQQKTPLTDAQKLDTAKKCGHNTWEEYKNSKWACTAPQEVKASGSVKSGQVVSQTATVTKQIQTSLGNQTPTGKITDAELDAILAKLG